MRAGCVAVWTSFNLRMSLTSNGVIVNWDEMTEIYRKNDPPLTDEFRALFELPKNALTDKEAEFLALFHAIVEA